MKARLLRAIDGAPGLDAVCLRGLLCVLSWLYRAGLEIDLATYPLGLAKVTRLPAEVISVGNLSMGGTGKTMATLELVRDLLDAGKRVAVLSRGYRRASHAEVVVVATPEGLTATARDAGDEPLLLACRLPGVPVLVGKNRRITGRQAIEQFGVDTLVLDDGFQYWRLAKDREIVLLDASQPAARDALLPRGFLREPWSHLRRAHEVWISHAELAAPERTIALAAQVTRFAPHVTLRYTEHHPTQLHVLPEGDLPLDALRAQPVLALSGLGNPEQFEAMLTVLGAVVTPCRYPDHHPYTDDDIAAIATQATDGRPVVTTAKDAIRLPANLPFPCWVVDVELVTVPAPRLTPAAATDADPA